VDLPHDEESVDCFCKPDIHMSCIVCLGRQRHANDERCPGGCELDGWLIVSKEEYEARKPWSNAVIVHRKNERERA